MAEQYSLFEQFNSFTLDTLPHSIILLGKLGCGKHTLCKNLAEHLHLNYFVISDKITLELLEQINNNIEPTLCVLNGINLDPKQESVLLKFIEEPYKHIFIIICCESTEYLLDTIKNRCQIFRFTDCSTKLLETIYNSYYNQVEINLEHKQLALFIADTPGKMHDWYNLPFIEMKNFCINIFSKINKANLASILRTSSERIDFKQEKTNKFQIMPLMSMFVYCAAENVRAGLPKSTEIYLLTINFINKFNIPNIDKKYLFEHYLLELKNII